jgi:hypothetical protein
MGYDWREKSGDLLQSGDGRDSLAIPTESPTGFDFDNISGALNDPRRNPSRSLTPTLGNNRGRRAGSSCRF